jgi:pyridoxine 4-dehydrogenase
VLEYCEENDLAFIPWFPLNAGNTGAMATIEKVAGKLGATAHQVALSWLLHHSPNILLIPGTSSVKQLEENLKAEKIELTEETMEELEG